MPRIVLDTLDFETVDALFVQAITTHPKRGDEASRGRAIMMEFAQLLRLEHEGRVNARHGRSTRARGRVGNLARDDAGEALDAVSAR